MSRAGICLVVAAVLFWIAALLVTDVFKGGPPVEAIALVAFGFWSISGAFRSAGRP